MIYYILKVLISSVIIVVISEVSKRSSLMGSIFASLPLVSVLAMIWLYVDTKSVEKVSELSTSIFWLVIPSLSLFLILPQMLKWKINFYLSLLISITIMVIIYYLMVLILEKFNIKL